MNKTRTIGLLFFIGIMLLAESLVAQQLPLFTQYREYHSFLNPAILHSDYVSLTYKPNSSAGFSYRKQWAELKDAPLTFAGRYEHILEDYSMLGGLNLIHDQTGPNSQSGGFLRYAYQAYFSRYTYLSIGGMAGVFQYQFDPLKGVTREPEDIEDVNNTNLEFALGVFFNTELRNNDVFYAGLSVPQISSINLSTSDKQQKARRASHFYGILGMYKYLSDGFGNFEGSVFLEPSLWLKYAPGAPLQTDLNLRLQMTDLIWLGVGYGAGLDEGIIGNFLHLEFGVFIGEAIGLYDSNIKIGYGYDNLLTGSNYIGFGSTHEINLTYSWVR